jgi:hypothetical protein
MRHNARAKLIHPNASFNKVVAVALATFLSTAGIVTLALKAAGYAAMLELEKGDRNGPVAVGSDGTASGGEFIQFGPDPAQSPPPPAPSPPPPAPPPPSSGTMPTPANTGPATEPTQSITPAQAVSARGASGKIITGEFRVDDWSGGYLGTTWNFSDCVIRGSFRFLIDNGSANYPVSQYPTINITRCRIEGSFVFIGAAYVNIDDTYVTQGAGMIAPCPDCAGSTYGLVREMPWVVTNSLFRSPPGNPSAGYHVEAAHIAGTGQGFKFINTRFIQEGPVNGTQTGSLFFHGGRSTFDGCYFDDGDQGVSNAYHYTVYVYGTGPGATSNVVKNSAIEKGMSWYVYPGGSNDPVTHATYTNNRDFHTKAALSLP